MCIGFMYGSVRLRPRELDHPTTLGIGCAIAFTSHTTSSPSMAHERAGGTLLKVVTFASRSFSTFFAIFSGLRPT